LENPVVKILNLERQGFFAAIIKFGVKTALFFSFISFIGCNKFFPEVFPDVIFGALWSY
jgi:hypothetical protein